MKVQMNRLKLKSLQFFTAPSAVKYYVFNSCRILKMLQTHFTTLFTILVFLAGVGKGDTLPECAGEFKRGELEITTGYYGKYTPKNNSDECSSLDIKVDNQSEKINWEVLERLSWTNLREFHLYLTTIDNFVSSEFEWKRLLLFGIEKSVYCSVYVNERRVYNYDVSSKYLSLEFIDVNPVLDAFEVQGVQELKRLSISNTRLEDLEDYNLSKVRVTSLSINNSTFQNFSGLIEKFKYLEVLSLMDNFEDIDISEILSASGVLRSVSIGNANLTVTETNKIHESESLKFLYLIDCTLDDSFQENAWKVMSNLTWYYFSYSTLTSMDLREISTFKQLKNLYLDNVNLTFQNPLHQFNTVKTFELTKSEIDQVKFVQVISKAFPNLTHLVIRPQLYSAKLSEEFLSNALKRLPDIQHIFLDPFNLITKSPINGTFEIRYDKSVTVSSDGVYPTSDNVERNHCKGQFKNGKLEITGKTQRGSKNISDACSNMEIRLKNVTELDWTEIEAGSWRKLEYFILNFTTDEFTLLSGNNFEWKRLLSFGSNPKHRTGGRQEIKTQVNTNNDNVFSFNTRFENSLSINRINPFPILTAVSALKLQLENLDINDIELENTIELFFPPVETYSLRLNNVQGENLSGLIQKFKCVNGLWLTNYERIDIGVILRSSTELRELVISSANLTCKDSTVLYESLEKLKLKNCVQDASFIENGWKVMPKLNDLKISSNKEKIDVGDLLVYKELRTINLENASLSFTKQDSQFNSLYTLILTNCEFERTNFGKSAKSFFPNLMRLSVDASLGGTKPTREFLNDVLVEFPQIQDLTLKHFEIFPNETSGIFNIVYTNTNTS